MKCVYLDQACFIRTGALEALLKNSDCSKPDATVLCQMLQRLSGTFYPIQCTALSENIISSNHWLSLIIIA